MIVGDGEAKPRVRLEPSIGRHHQDGGRFEGKLRWEDQLAVVETSFVERVVRSSNYVMPLQDVGGQGLCHNVGDRILNRSRYPACYTLKRITLFSLM